MKAVILAGGLGTRLAEETDVRPKPMVEIGGRPLLWHIMQIYAHHGITDFVICLGYKGYVIKEFFMNFFIHTSDIEIDLKTGSHRVINNSSPAWTVTLVDTGLESMTGERLRRVKPYLDETFCLTYGDGLADIDLTALVAYHRRSRRLATVTAVTPPGRFGVLEMDDAGGVTAFREKPGTEGGWINGGFFVLEPPAIDYIQGANISWEQEPLANLARDGQLAAFRHEGFWQPCDTLRDKRALEALWETGRSPWRIWQS
jgi:glucose-1-phosphate cytidylyltransferase